jgi:hypothetical protein
VAAKPIPRDDLIGTTWRVIRDCYTIIADFLWWLWTRLWRLNRGLVRTFLPGQKRPVHNVVTVCLVLLEIVGLYVAVVDFVQRH